MGIFSNVQEFLRKRKQLKLDKAKKERESEFCTKVQSQIDRIVNDDNLSDERKKEKLYLILTYNIEEAKSLGVVENGNVNDLATYLKNYGGIADAVRFKERKKMEDKICDYLTVSDIDSFKLQKLIEEHIERYYSDDDGIESLELSDEKKHYDIICSMIQSRYEGLEGSKRLALNGLNSAYRNIYVIKISESSTPQEMVEAYNEYVMDFLGGDSEKVDEFRQDYIDVDVLRKIDLINELGTSNFFPTMDSIPLFYDMTKETVDEDMNEEIAAEKRGKRVTPKDLLFIRTTNTFPRDSILETIGQYSEYEDIGNPFITVLRNLEPGIKDEDINLKSPRFRWTSHWCINAIVGNHAWGDFSGRDFFVIEDANEQANNKRIINRLVADVIHVGDMKLSQNAKVMMTVEKYKELLEDPQMKEQLGKMGIILYKGTPQEALKKYMNDNGYVYGKMASSHYQLAHSEAVDEFLNRVVMENIPGYEHCASMLDESLLMTYLEDPETIKVFEETGKATREIIGSDEDQNFYNRRTTINEMSASIDEHLSHRTFCKYIEYLSRKFPQMETLLEAYKKAKANPKEEKANFEQISEKIIREIGVQDIVSCTKEFNEIMAEVQKLARSTKDRQLLESGMITQDEYNARVNGNKPIEKTQE